MKKLLFVVALFIGVTAFGQKKKDLLDEVAKLKAEATELKAQLNQIQKSKEVNLEDELHKFCYAFGLEIGRNLKTIGIDSIPYNAFEVGIEEVTMGKERMSQDEARNVLKNYAKSAQETRGKKIREAGELFLAENAERTGVITTESGLQYEVLKQGKGVRPIDSDEVKVHYEGKLINGEIFDSSIERGEPMTFGVTQVIPGWTEALQLMQVGSKWKVFIPQDLAYGERGAGEKVPPYSVLIFEMELLAIE